MDRFPFPFPAFSSPIPSLIIITLIEHLYFHSLNFSCPLLFLLLLLLLDLKILLTFGPHLSLSLF